MSFELRLLGPVELQLGGQRIPLGPPKQRALLAALALDANHPLPLSSLVAAVWSRTPPPSAVANLRTYVAGLRSHLGDRLIARSGAYELRVADGELDATVFVRRAATGRHALSGGDLVAAHADLAAALDLWRGPAGDGLARGTTLDTQFAALDDQRLDVFEDWVQARLGLGHYDQVAIRLRQHLAGNPLRERAWGQLMLVLYRSGNILGALAAYREAGAALRQQLGVEPGPDLVALHRAMLDRDPALRDVPVPHRTRLRPDRGPSTAGPAVPAAPAGGIPPGWPTPLVANGAVGSRPRPASPVPANSDTFVGRVREVDEVTAALRAGAAGTGPAAVVIGGRSGMGKSALAAHAARLATAAFPGGQLTIELGKSATGSRDPEDIVGQGLRTLGVEPAQLPATFDECAGLFRSLVSTRRVLVRIEDATTAAQLRPLVPPAGGALLVTARRPLATLEGAALVDLGPVDVADGIALLSLHLGATRLADERQVAAELVRRCEGLPLALRIVAARLARRPGWPLALLAEHLADDPLDGLQFDDLSVRASVAADLEMVGAEDELAVRSFALLGCAEGRPLTVREVTAGLCVSRGRVFHALEKLVDAGLAESPQPGHYRLPSLVRHYAAEQCTTRPLCVSA